MRSSSVATDFGILRAQIEWIEVEPQVREQGQAEDRGCQGRSDHPIALLFEKAVERRQRRISDRRRLAGGFQNGEQSRQQRHGGRERDKHAGPGDQPEFREADVGGRQEGIERGRDRGCGKQKRPLHLARRCQKRRLEIGRGVPFSSVADAELDPEIDAEPDEEHRKRNRDEVQRPDHPQPHRGGENEPDHKADKDGQDDAGLLERQPQHKDDDEESQGAVQTRAVGHGGEFLVGKSNRSGEADFDALLRRQVKPQDRLADGRGRLASGLKSVEVENRLDVDEASKVGGLGRPPGNQPAPGKARIFSLCQAFQGVGDGDDSGPQILEFGLSPSHALDRLRQSAKNAAQRRIGGQCAEERLGLDQLGGVAAHLVDGKKEEAVAREELAAVGASDGADHVRARRKVLDQRVRRLVGSLRGRRIDDGDDQVGRLGERLVEHDLLLAPGKRA